MRAEEGEWDTARVSAGWCLATHRAGCALEIDVVPGRQGAAAGGHRPGAVIMAAHGPEDTLLIR